VYADKAFAVCRLTPYSPMLPDEAYVGGEDGDGGGGAGTRGGEPDRGGGEHSHRQSL